MRGFCFTSHELFWLEYVCCLSTSSLSESLTFHIFNFFSRTAGPISTNLSSNHHWVKGVQVCSKKGHAFFKRIIMYDYWTFVDIFQNSSFQKQFVQKKKIFNYGRFRFVQIMNPGQCGDTLGEAGDGGGDGGSNYYIWK